MLQALFDYFYNLFELEFSWEDTLFNWQVYVANGKDGFYSMDLQSYLAFICSLIGLVFVFILCCLFIYRLIRLVGRLFSGGAL